MNERKSQEAKLYVKSAQRAESCFMTEKHGPVHEIGRTIKKHERNESIETSQIAKFYSGWVKKTENC